MGRHCFDRKGFQGQRVGRGGGGSRFGVPGAGPGRDGSLVAKSTEDLPAPDLNEWIRSAAPPWQEKTWKLMNLRGGGHQKNIHAKTRKNKLFRVMVMVGRPWSPTPPSLAIFQRFRNVESQKKALLEHRHRRSNSSYLVDCESHFQTRDPIQDVVWKCDSELRRH